MVAEECAVLAAEKDACTGHEVATEIRTRFLLSIPCYNQEELDNARAEAKILYSALKVS